MPDRIPGSIITVALAGVAVAALSVPLAMAQAPAKSGPATGWAVKTPWGDPNLQGIWTDPTDTPLQRSPKYASQEFLTEEQRVEFDRMRASFLGRDRRSERGTEADVAGAYNAIFTPLNRTGARTSRIVDPPNGRLPQLTA